MKSFTGKFTSARGWVLMIALLLGAGLMISACGDEEVPAPTTPAPPPPPPEPEPEPEPEPPATPTGLMVSGSTATSITWTWNTVEGATGYVVQANTDEMWDDDDTVIFTVAGAMVPFTTETTYTASDLETGTTMYVRVAAAAGTPDAYVTSAFSTHVTGTAEAPPPDRPPAPANVRLKKAGSNYIEWEWDPVAGADGYQSQFSADGSSFGSQESHMGMGSTTRRVSNLSPETAGYLRVRSYTGSGTGADTVLGDEWSDPNRQETGEAPPPEPLDAPENVRSPAQDEESITLAWDEVDAAETYEVEFREEGASTWDDADCGDDSNVVTEEECVATGLDAGTDYEFRVRGVPVDDDDDAHLVGAWSDIEDTRTAGTAAPDPTDPTPGGMGELRIQWESDHDSIDFVWDRIAGSTYQYSILDESEMGSANPCRDAGWSDVSFASLTYVEDTEVSDGDISPGNVKGLCVRTSDGSSVSYAWGILPPEEPGVADSVGGTATTNKSKTTALQWGGVSLVEGFDYEIRVAADPERSSTIGATATALDREVQDACSVGREVERGTADITYSQTNVVDGNKLMEYTGYLLCLRYRNDAGASVWSVPVSSDNDTEYNTSNPVVESFTLPAKPPRPNIVPSLTRTTEPGASSNGSVQPVWSSAVRKVTTVPRQFGGFEASAWLSSAASAKGLTSADCVAVGETDPEGYSALALAAPPITDTGQGIQIATNAAVNRLGFDQKAYVCLRATNNGVDEGGPGPWEISLPYTIQNPAGLAATVTFQQTPDPNSDPKTYSVTVAVAIKEWNTDWRYTVQVDAEEPGVCTSVTTGSETTINWDNLPLRQKRTVRVFANEDECTDGTLIKTSGNTIPRS